MIKAGKIVCIASVLLFASCADEGVEISKTGTARSSTSAEAPEAQSPLERLANSDDS